MLPELLKKASTSIKGPTQEVQKELKIEKGLRSVLKISEMTRVATTKTKSPELVATSQTNRKDDKKNVKEVVKQLAARVASLATAEAAKSIAPLTLAYQFEVSCQGFSMDRTL
nr:RNA polymerase II-associated protein 3 isoform X1 [Tanacetum cinerariifolium]